MRTFCIVCPEIAGEEDRAKKHFDEMGVPAEFIWGVHGQTSGLDTIHTYEQDHPGTGYKIGPKTVAMNLSHYMAWSSCLYLPDEHFLILESDAKFPPDWKERMEQAIADTPKDFDLLYVGSCNCENKHKARIKGHVYHMTAANPHNSPHCTHAIIIAKKAIPVLLKTQRKVYTGIDLALTFNSLPYLKFYVVLPRIVDQFNTEIAP